jgi:spermidine/putrescine transport system ATP-binding protein
MLEISHVSKYYDNQLLLDDISFKVSADETVCLLGPSGGGKSTLLRIIAGLEELESGQVRWQGEDITAKPAHTRRFGLMFQDYALFPHMTVGENVAFGLRMQHTEPTEIRKRVAEALEMVNMGTFAQRRVTDLSGGEQQRVAMARALVPRPQLLMLDEPLGALDRALREQLSGDLRSVLDRMNIPVIYVTHDQEEAFTFGDRLLILHEGKIIQSGRPEQLYNHPESLWLAAFFGQKNQLSGRVAGLKPLRVQTDYGMLVCGQQPGNMQINQAVTLVLPVDSALLTTQTENALRARVKHVRFQGIGFMIDFQLADDRQLTFFLSNSLPVGEQVNLAIQSQSILCFS